MNGGTARISAEVKGGDSARMPYLAVADVYDIMTHEQCYRKAFSSQEAVKELRKGSGTQFDPQVLAQFIQLLPELVEKPNQEP